jgi:hypothetical protein
MENIVHVDFKRLAAVTVEYEPYEVAWIRAVAAEDGQSLQEFMSSATRDCLQKPPLGE